MAPNASRRGIVIALGAVALAAPVPGFSQQKIYRIGYLSNDPEPRTSSHTFKAFMMGLQELGWTEGKNIDLRIRTSGGREERLPQLAAELVRERVDIIVTSGSAATRAANAATDRIPIVFGSAANPVEQKLVASLARPGGNVTGLALFVQELGPKRLQLLKEMMPGATRFTRVYQAGSIASVQPAIMSEDDAAARQLGITLEHVPVADMAAVEAAFAGAVRLRTHAMILTGAPLFVANREVIAGLALKYGLATMTADVRFAEAGALVSYGENFVSRYRRAAFLVDKILRGAKPSDIPVEQPALFELVVNLKTAKALGVTPPESFLLQADRVIR